MRARVAYVCADAGVPVFGQKGCSVHVREICNAMIESGLDLTLFAARRGGDPIGRLRDARIVDLPAPTSTDAASREREAIDADEQTRSLLAASGPFDIVYERASLWSAAPMAHAAALSVPGILELNAPLVDEQARYRTLVHRDAAEAILTRGLTAARLVVAVSEEVAASARELTRGAAHVRVVPNGVDIRRFPFVEPGASRDRFVVGFVGTLKPWHGLTTLIEAFAQFASTVGDSHLLVVGDGPERQNIEQRLERLRLSDRVTMTGAVAHDQVPALLRLMNVGVAPYPPLERFYFSPLKILEYMAAGLPVVASAIGQVTSLVRDGQTGLLFAPGDSEGLAVALRRLHGDSLLRRRLGGAARELVAAHWTWERVLARIFASIPEVGVGHAVMTR